MLLSVSVKRIEVAERADVMISAVSLSAAQCEM